MGECRSANMKRLSRYDHAPDEPLLAGLCLTRGRGVEYAEMRGTSFFRNVPTVLPLSGFVGGDRVVFGVVGAVPYPKTDLPTPEMARPQHNSGLHCPQKQGAEVKGGKMLFTKLAKLFVVMGVLAFAMVPSLAEAG
jgi:hypothetical protein